jgi:hypothetical protein
MGIGPVWDRRRYATLAIVIGVHAALLAALWLYAPPLPPTGSAARPLELVYLAPPPPSKIRPDNLSPHHIGSDVTMSIAPPVIGSLSIAPSTAGADGNGAGVDWRAEARRALQAFEIRNTKRTNSPAPSGSSADTGWWPQTLHHAGDQYKTDSGDWIVWINSSCYQVAKAASSYALGAVLPQTICPGQDTKPRGDLFKDLPAYKADHPDG